MNQQPEAPASRRRDRSRWFDQPTTWLYANVTLVTVFAAVNALMLWWSSRHLDRPPLWDMAENGWNAYQLATDLSRLHLFDFLRHFALHDLWPPGYSLMSAPFLLLGGGTFASAVVLQTLSHILIPVALVLLAFRVSPNYHGLTLGLLSFFLWVGSPSAAVFALLIMRELPGALLTLVAILTYINAYQRDSLPAWRGSALATLALIFLKYNYGLAWVVTVLLHQALVLAPERRRTLASAMATWVLPWKASSWPVRLISSLLWLGAALFLAGVSIGGGLWGLLVVITIGLLPRLWRQRSALGKHLVALSPRARSTFEILVIPLWLWFLLPTARHIRGAIGFLDNRSSSLGFLEQLTFYPQTFIHNHVQHPSIGIAVLLLAAVGTVSGLRSRNEAWRIPALFAVVMAALCTVHGYKTDRFLLTLTPILFLLAPIGLLVLLQKLAPRSLSAQSVTSWGLRLTLVALAFLGPLSDGSMLPFRAAALAAEQSGPPEILEITHRLAAWSVRANPRVGANPRVAVLGAFNQLSPDLIRWVAKRDHPGSAEIVEPPRRAAVDIVAWLDKEEINTVLGIELSSGSPLDNADYADFNKWKAKLLVTLGESGHWRTVDQMVDRQLRLRVTALHRIDRESSD